MAKEKQAIAKSTKDTLKRGTTELTSLPIFQRGIKTSRDFNNGMSALMTDVVSGAVSPGVANAACNAGGKLLKSVELQIKYGTAIPDSNQKQLKLAD